MTVSEKKVKVFSIVALALGSSAVLAACGSSGSNTSATNSTTAKKSAPVTVTLWESHNGGPVGDEMTTMVDNFNATHVGVKVNIVVTKASSKLLAAIAAGDPPTLAEISHYDGKYVRSGALASWNSYITKSSVVAQGNMLPAAWRNGEVGSTHYRLETDMKLSEVFYNQSLFAKAGISTAPQTDAQMATDAAKLKALGVIPIGWKDSSAHILPTFLSNGGSMLKGSNSVGHSVAFNNAAGTATFSYFHHLYAAGELQFHHGTTLREDFASGKIGMIDGTSAGYAKVLAAVAGAFKVGAFVEPSGSSGVHYNLAQGLGFVMPKADTTVQRNAAWTFVQWWFGAKQQAAWAMATGFAPETKAGIADVPASFLTTHPGLKASLAAALSPHTFPRPVSDSYNEVQASLDAEFFNAVTGKQSISSSLSTLQSQGDSYMSGASEL
ncbi:extracellular solute-binding protein [Ferrimicrobium acidiphilum]|uniref:extracellular solute-binding protein n=1 Tax=Ferrimicrobium acidiphilum TaxID=121039 RepID=UPI0023F27E6F|nr:extracellular solute-binding protein [Ferrimicrobium acidiphilum]